MRAPTAQRILESARKLFNERGIMHVRLQHIADEARISVGNLAYHFRNKEAIVLALYEPLHQSQQHVLSLLRQVPLFVQVHELLARHWGVQLAYRFFYLDTLDILRRESVDLVLINRKLDADYSDGMDIIRTLKADPKLAATPVMLISNFEDAQKEAVEAGAVPGFGKAELSSERARECVARVLESDRVPGSDPASD